MRSLCGDRRDRSSLVVERCDCRVKQRDTKFCFNDVVDVVNVHSQKVAPVKMI